MNSQAANASFAGIFRELTGYDHFRWQFALFGCFLSGNIPPSCDLPTGLGKTSVIPIWLIALAQQSLAGRALLLLRRLTYVVNRRTVGDQATKVVEQIREKLTNPSAGTGLATLRDALRSLYGVPGAVPALSTLRGELADNGAWKLDPSRPAIIIGTVDMIGSKLLFRGYGDSEYFRPHHAGLLGQDTLFVHDEAHLTPAFSALLFEIRIEQVAPKADATRRSAPLVRETDRRAIDVLELSATPTTNSRRKGTVFSLTSADGTEHRVLERVNARKQLTLHAIPDGDELVKQIVARAVVQADRRCRVLIYVESPKTAQAVRRAGAAAGIKSRVLRPPRLRGRAVLREVPGTVRLPHGYSAGPLPAYPLRKRTREAPGRTPCSHLRQKVQRQSSIAQRASNSVSMEPDTISRTECLAGCVHRYVGILQRSQKVMEGDFGFFEDVAERRGIRSGDERDVWVAQTSRSPPTTCYHRNSVLSRCKCEPTWRGASMEEFDTFFDGATGVTPYPYQRRFATAGDISHLLRVPTGAGKTATAIIGWLHRRISRPTDTPRRLVYCLPMRVLVEQSEREARRWLTNLGLNIPVHVLMGGVESAEWFLDPEQPAVLIGTQDMLLSRSLNRGYAASRFHWPIDFALLNNDCLWIFDEPQLMANGVSTSAQLAGLRHTFGTFGDCPSVWMSATLEPSWLDTIDFRGKFTGEPLELQEDDYDPGRPLFKRMTAEKVLRPLGVASTKDMREVAQAILGTVEPEVHQPNTQTLVILNTVERAKAVYNELLKLRKKSDKPALLLIHSRFRAAERWLLNEHLQQSELGHRIIVATQVVEAGVDISSRTLVTELAPWASLVQRMGRCNRTGTDGPGRVFWIDLNERLSAPYAWSDLSFARDQLRKLDGHSVSPKNIDQFNKQERITLSLEHNHVLRRRDLLDLFDTSPDLSGNDIDIQRFVRSDDPETDVQVFWRDVGGQGPDPDEPAPRREELCNVPIGQAREFLEGLSKKKRAAGYVWDHLDERWVELDPRQLRPGWTILLPSTAGGYDWDRTTQSGKGWDLDSDAVVGVVPGAVISEEGAGSDPNSALAGPALTIAQHTQNVCRELEALLKGLDLPAEWRMHLAKSAAWHDVGKAHAAFQQGLRSANAALDVNELWAKSGKNSRLKHGRKYFRHELASALAAIQQDFPFAVAYLVAAHHGRVRLAIRALPDEDEPTNPEKLFALGIHDGDPLPEVKLNGETCPAMTLDLSPMQLGGIQSWTANALKLLGELGPFRLAYLEALLRAADLRASHKEALHA